MEGIWASIIGSENFYLYAYSAEGNCGIGKWFFRHRSKFHWIRDAGVVEQHRNVLGFTIELGDIVQDTNGKFCSVIDCIRDDKGGRACRVVYDFQCQCPTFAPGDLILLRHATPPEPILQVSSHNLFSFIQSLLIMPHFHLFADYSYLPCCNNK